MSSRPWPFDSNGVPAAAGDPREGPTRRALDASAGRPARESPEVSSGQQITRQPSIARPRARRGPCRCFAEASSRQRRSPLRASRRRRERPASCGRQTCRVPWLPLVGVGALAQLVGGARGTRDTSQKPILARRVASVCGDTTTSAQTVARQINDAVRPLQGRALTQAQCSRVLVLARRGPAAIMHRYGAQARWAPRASMGLPRAALFTER